MRSIILCFLFGLVLLTGCSKTPEEAFNEAKQVNDINAYEGYLKNYPESEYTEEAKNLLYGLHFEKAKEQNTIKAYEDFITNCPENKFTEETKNKLHGLYDEAIKTVLASINNANKGTPFSVRLLNFDHSTGTLNIRYRVAGFRPASALLGIFVAGQSLRDIAEAEQKQKQINAQWVSGNNEYIKQNLGFVKKLNYKVFTN
jgi:hypothetical protein